MSYTQVMHILRLYVVGSPQESWQNEAISQYLLRLKPFAKVEQVELPDERESATVPASRLRAKEAEALLRRIPSDSIVIALDETGKTLTSQEWADFIEEKGGRGAPLAFVMGGANGLDPSVRARANHVFSLGKQTLPHILARIVLLEQLYRAETILNGKTYHR